MPPNRDPGAAHRDGDQVVEAQCHHCGPARRCPPQDDHTIPTPLQVPPPTRAPRTEKADTPPGQRIAPMDLLACAQLARPAGEPEVAQFLAYMAPPWFPRAMLCDNPQDHACTPIYGLLCEDTVPPGLDGFRALPPPQFDDL